MMRAETIAEQLFFSTVKIEANHNDGKTSIATGFVITHAVKEDEEHPFLVTNRHVIQNTSGGHFTLTHAESAEDYRPLLGETILINLSKEQWSWIGHPSANIDVAVLPLEPIFDSLSKSDTSYFIKAIPTDLRPTEEDAESFDAVEEVLFVGYPNGIYDSVNNLPIARTGITATPTNINYAGRPVFLIDASVFPGSSGSPVFRYSPSVRLNREGVIGRRQFRWLGIVAAAYYEDSSTLIETQERILEPHVTAKARQMIDLGIVYKASCVVETIEHALFNSLWEHKRNMRQNTRP